MSASSPHPQPWIHPAAADLSSAHPCKMLPWDLDTAGIWSPRRQIQANIGPGRAETLCQWIPAPQRVQDFGTVGSGPGGHLESRAHGRNSSCLGPRIVTEKCSGRSQKHPTGVLTITFIGCNPVCLLCSAPYLCSEKVRWQWM